MHTIVVGVQVLGVIFDKFFQNEWKEEKNKHRKW